MLKLTKKQVDEINARLDSIYEAAKLVAAAMHDMRNDLCALCGKYKQAHEGACDDCRWRDV
jgi:hypothetical protein